MKWLNEKKTKNAANALREFDLSPVTKIENKNKKAMQRISKSLHNYFFSKFVKRKLPIIIKKKPSTKAPAIGSSLKKPTILGPKNSP